MAQEYNDGLSKVAPAVDDTATDSGHTLPPLQFGTVEDELPAEARERVHNTLPVNLEPGWHTIKTRLQSIYGGKLPFVSKDVRPGRAPTYVSALNCLFATGHAVSSCYGQQWSGRPRHSRQPHSRGSSVGQLQYFGP